MLENWYELARTIPGHNATVFETRQLVIYGISAFLMAIRKFVFWLRVPTRLLLSSGVHA